MQVVGQRNAAAPQLFKQREVSFEKLGIGGLDQQFEQIFRRAFASRVFPPEMVRRNAFIHQSTAPRPDRALAQSIHSFNRRSSMLLLGWCFRFC